MRTRMITWLVMIVVSVGGLLLVSRYIVAKPSTAEETKRKWEYCLVYPSYQKGDKYVAQVMFPSTPEGKTDEIENSLDGMRALNKLGAEGWELVGPAPNPTTASAYLMKRAKQ